MDKKRIFSVEFIVTALVIIALIIIFIPKFLNTPKQAKECTVAANLSVLRSAIALYYADNDGNYPQGDVAKALVSGGYISKIPKSYSCGYHEASNKIVDSKDLKGDDTGEWAYKSDKVDDSSGRNQGEIWLNCTHKNSKGEVMSEF